MACMAMFNVLTPPRPLVLASSSPYRRELLGRLGLAFETAAPEVDESQRPGETAGDYVTRLARDKAAALAPRFPEALLIGSDQAAVLDDAVLGKPGTPENTIAQLEAASGRTVRFFTAVHLLDAGSGCQWDICNTCSVYFRELTTTEIERYVERERPFDCAGGFRAEGLGIALFERLETDDPTGLVGLPLIGLSRLLREAGLPAP